MCGEAKAHGADSSWLCQALSQCDGYLTRMGVVKEAVDDTAGAAKAIAQLQLRCVVRCEAPWPLDACAELERAVQRLCCGGELAGR